jgi:hypothetical protein
MADDVKHVDGLNLIPWPVFGRSTTVSTLDHGATGIGLIHITFINLGYNGLN